MLSRREFYKFQDSDASIQLIIGCTAVFILYAVMHLGFGKPEPLNWLLVQSNWRYNLLKPWSFITYAFVHQRFAGLFFNMIFLYCSAQLFYTLFSVRNMLVLFFTGALAGSLAFQLVALTGLLPAGHSLAGASAGAYAVFSAICIYRPSFEVHLFGAFRFKVIYLLMLLIAANLLYLVIGANIGGEVAHFGAIIGAFAYTKTMLLKGRSLHPLKIFKRRTKGKLTKVDASGIKKPTYRGVKGDTERELDKILEKISRSGYRSLSKQEKEFLKETSRELNGKP